MLWVGTILQKVAAPFLETVRLVIMPNNWIDIGDLHLPVIARMVSHLELFTSQSASLQFVIGGAYAFHRVQARIQEIFHELFSRDRLKCVKWVKPGPFGF